MARGMGLTTLPRHARPALPRCHLGHPWAPYACCIAAGTAIGAGRTGRSAVEDADLEGVMGGAGGLGG